MASRFDTVSQSNIINTYQPVPYQEILQAGMARQNGYNQSLDFLNQTQEQVGLVNTIQGSEDERRLNEEIIPEMNKIAEDYANKDLSNPLIVRKLNREIQSRIPASDLSKFEQSYGNYLKAKDLENKLRIENRYAPELGVDASGYDSRTGVFTGSPEGVLDYNQRAETYFNNIKDSILSSVDPVTGQYTYGVGDNIIEQVSGENVDSFLSSPEGNQLVRRQGIDPNSPEAREAAYDFLVDRGQEFKRRMLRQLSGYGSGSGKGNEHIPFEFSVEKFFGTEEIPKQYSDIREGVKVSRELENKVNEIQSLLQDPSNINPAKKIQLESQLAQKQEELEKTKNAVQAPLLEAEEKFGADLAGLAIDFEVEDLPYMDEETGVYYSGSAGYQKAAKEIEDKKFEYAQEIAPLFGNYKSFSEAIQSIPATTVSRDETGQIIGKTLFAGETSGRATELANFIAGVLNDPDPDKYRIESAPGTNDANLKDFKGASMLTVAGVSNPADATGSFIGVTAAKEGRKGKLEKIGGYKIYLNTPTQYKAVADVYMKNNNPIDALKWTYPGIEQTVQNKTQGGGVDNFKMNILNQELDIRNQGKNQWKVIFPDGRESAVYSSSQLSNYLYKILALNSNFNQ